MWQVAFDLKMAGHLKKRGMLKLSDISNKTSTKRWELNLEAICEKYGKEFPNDDEINLSKLEFNKDKGSVRGMTGNRTFGISPLRCTSETGKLVCLSTANNRQGQTDERLQTLMGLKRSYDPNVSMAITHHQSSSSSCAVPISVGSHGSPSNTINRVMGSNVCSCLDYVMQTGHPGPKIFCRRPDDSEGEPSDAETDSGSSAEDSDEEEESKGFESGHEDLEQEESSEKFVETSSDKNNVVAGGWRKQGIMGRKELENESRTDEVGKSGNKSGRVSLSGKEQHNENERERDGERKHVKKTTRVLLTSVREVVNESGREQLKNERGLATENGRVSKGGRVQPNVNGRVGKGGRGQPNVNARGGRAQANVNGRVGKGGRAQPKVNGRVGKGGRAQPNVNGRVGKGGRAQTNVNGRVGKGGRAQPNVNGRVGKGGRAQPNVNGSEQSRESGSEHVNKHSNVLIKSNTVLVNESEKAQLKSGNELANKSGGELANKKGRIQLKSGRELSNKTGKDIHEGGKRQSGAEQAERKEERISKCGTELGCENGQSQNHADVTRSDFFINTACLDNSTSSTLRNLPFVSYQSSKPVMKETSVKKCATIPSDNKHCPISPSLQSAQNENVTRSDDFFNTFCLDSSTSSTLRNLSFVSYQSSKPVMKEISLKECAIIPSVNKRCTIFQNLQPAENETFVCENTSLSATKPGDHISTHLSCVSSDNRNPGPALLGKKSLTDWRKLQKDDSVIMDTTYVKSDSLSTSCKFEGPVSKSHAQIDSSRQKSENGMKKRASTSFMNLQTDHSVNMNVTYDRPGLFNISSRCEDPVSELQLSSSLGTGRFGDVSLRSRSTTASRTLQSDHSSSGTKMPTNRKSENDKYVYKSPFPSLQTDCSVNVDHSINMDVTFVKSRLFEASFRHKSPVSELQVPLSSDTKRYEKSVSELHLFSTSDTGRYEDMSQRSGSATANHNLQSEHPISAKGRSTNVLQKAKSGRKSQADHSSKVNITPEELTSPYSKLTSPNSNMAPSHSSLTFSCTKSMSLRTILQSPPSSSASSAFNLASPRSNLASPRSNLASPRSNLASPRSNLASPRSNLASPCFNLSSPPSIMALSHFQLASPPTKLTTSPSNSIPSNLTFSCSNGGSTNSNLESPNILAPSRFNMSSSSSLECSPFSTPYEYSNSPATSSILTLSRSNLTAHRSFVSKQHNSNEGLAVCALPESNGYDENLVENELHIECPNYVQKGVQTEPQCQSTNFQNICSFFDQFLVSHEYNQEKWASPRCENATDQCSQILAYGRLKRKASCSSTSGYFTDASASPKCMQTCSAVRLDDNQVMNITFTRPSVKTQCLPEPACTFQGHIQQQPHLPEFCSLHRSEKTVSQMEESNHTFCRQNSGHDDFSRADENVARRFAVAKKQRHSGSCQFANPGSSNQQQVKDNWYCLRHCAAREDCSCRPPSRTDSAVCEWAKATTNQNSHDISVQEPPRVNDSRVCTWIKASIGATNLRSNPVRHTSCFPRMQQIKLRDCSPGQLATSVISSCVASLRHVEEASSSSQAPFYFQSNHHGNPQTKFKDRITHSADSQNHASSCHFYAKDCVRACLPCDEVAHSSKERQVHAVWKEIQAERLGADTRSGNMDGHQNKSCVLGSSESLWSERIDTGGRLDELVGPKGTK